MMGMNQMNPMMGMGMNPMMGMNQMNPMMGMGMNPTMGQNVFGDTEGWNLVFEEKSGGKKTTIRINPDKTVQEAINLYKIKNGTKENFSYFFIFNGKQLNYQLKISQSGLKNFDKITVISKLNLIGGK